MLVKLEYFFHEREREYMNIYVGNLSFDATEEEVRELFAAFGQVASVSLIKDKFTGRPRGFGFVEMSSDSEAQKAIQELNGKDFKGRSMTINQARPRENSGYGRGGGYGGDRRGGSNRDRRGQPGGGDQRRRDW
jgi:cold-inducible RNA-binding protein